MSAQDRNGKKGAPSAFTRVQPPTAHRRVDALRNKALKAYRAQINDRPGATKLTPTLGDGSNLDQTNLEDWNLEDLLASEDEAA